MKTKNSIQVSIAALAALFLVPQLASAQVRGSYVRPGAAGNSNSSNAPVSQSSAVMRSGAIERGRPNFNSNPINSGNFGNQTLGNGPGTVVVLPEATMQFHRPNYSSSNDSVPTNINSNYLPPIGPGNGFFNNLTPPIGPANGFGQTIPERLHRPGWDDGSNSSPVIITAPVLGGYYYGGYCENYAPAATCPSVYSVYSGFPPYIYGPGVVVISQPYVPVYITPSLPYFSQEHTDAARTFQAVFADIARAWTGSDITLLRRHLRDSDTRISVSLNHTYSYSIASGDFSEITRDALDRLHTVSFEFTRFRKAKNGDVTAYATHRYRAGDGTRYRVGEITTSNASPYDQANDPANGTVKTVYVSYTLHCYNGEWSLIAMDSSTRP